MTNEEALTYLRQLVAPSARHLEAMRLAKEALEKQIPKKPIPTMEEQDDGTKALSFKCPACNEFLFIGDWCWYCGQRLDWSEDE